MPILELGNRIGDTDYIDFIKPEMMNQPVMRGVDVLTREFFTIKFRNKEHPEQLLCQTFFQRHTGMDLWSSGCTLFPSPILVSSTVDDDGFLDNIQKFLVTRQHKGWEIAE